MSDKLDLESKDLIAQKLEQLEQLFPNLVTEGENGKVLDLDQLKNEFSTEVVEGTKERYRLEWPGKKEAIVTANLPTTKTLRPVKEDSVDFDNTENLYIEGDNLEVLKVLQESYFGKIKMIYIDPPYNTGEDFIYTDDYSSSGEEELLDGGQLSDTGKKLVKNADTSGRFHSRWLSMLYPVLKSARNLLTKDGCVFISIGDDELHNLLKLCDDVFGHSNFVNVVSVNMKNIAGASGGGEDKRLKKNIEYLVMFARDYSSLKPFKNAYEYIPIHELVEQYREEGVSWKYTSALVDEGKKEYFGSTVDGDGNEIKIFKRVNPSFMSINQIMNNEGLSEKDAYKKYANVLFQTAMPQSSIRPRVMDKVQELGGTEDFYSIEYVPRSGKNKGNVYEQFYKGASFRLLAWLKDVSEEIDGVIYKKELQGTFWDFAGETKNLTKEGGIAFPNGKKPLNMITRILSLFNDSDGTFLDFFSGSATTAHAVMKLNSEDNGKRKHIMVQIPEATDEKSEAFKVGYRNICEIGKERIRRAGAKIKEETGADIDYGFRVYRLDESNMADVYHTPQDYDQDNLELFADNVKEGRTADDLLAQIMLDWGLPLSLPIEEVSIAGKRVFQVAGNSLMACFETGIDEAFAKEIATEEPLRIVFKDAGFSSDTAKSNVKQLLKQLSPETEMKVI